MPWDNVYFGLFHQLTGTLNDVDEIISYTTWLSESNSAPTPFTKIAKSEYIAKERINTDMVTVAVHPCSLVKHTGDRFIPYRQALDVDRAHHAILSPLKDLNTVDSNHTPPVTPKQQSSPFSDLLDKECGVTPDKRMFSFTPKSCRDYFRSKGIGSLGGSCTPGTPKTNKNGSRIRWTLQAALDLPGLQDDFYTNTLDWSSGNVLVVALGRTVALWNIGLDDGVNISVDFASHSPTVTSLAWDPPGEQLAMGSSRGEIVLIDHKELKTKSSFFCVDHNRIGVLTWDNNTFFSGSKKGVVSLHDPRSPLGTFARLKHNTFEICGLKCSSDNRLLASGSANGELLVWDIGERKIFQKIQAHTSANRALAWVPNHHRTLVTGGGASDGHLKMWNVNDQTLLFDHNTECQVSCALWSTEHMALMTGHGVPSAEGNDVLIWKWSPRTPQLEYVTSMKGQRARTLHMAISPDGNTVASAGAEEILRLWKLSSPKKRRSFSMRSVLQQTIR